MAVVDEDGAPTGETITGHEVAVWAAETAHLAPGRRGGRTLPGAAKDAGQASVQLARMLERRSAKHAQSFVARGLD